MAQAHPITTATGEGVSHGGLTKSTSLRSAHTEPAAALPPHLIRIGSIHASILRQSIRGASPLRIDFRQRHRSPNSPAVASIANI